MNLNERLQPVRMSISTVHREFSSGGLFVDDSFQRRSVWSHRNKTRLIETVLIGYPMPELYFWSQPPQPDGQIRQSVVDGQQRIRSVTEFVTDRFKLLKSHVSEERREEEFVGKFFSELDITYKNIIWSYQMNVRTIPHSVDRQEIKKIFLRLNETDKALNPQEKRNAQFSGKFAQLAEELAELPFWKEWRVFSPSAIRRMSDVTFVSQLLSFLRLGMSGDITPVKLNYLYNLFNERYPKAKRDKEVFIDVLSDLDEMFESNGTTAAMFTKTTHMYPLFLSAYALRDKLSSDSEERKTQLKQVSAKLAKFAKRYDAKKNTFGDIDLTEYRLASNEGFNKRSNREAKYRAIHKIISSAL